MRLSGYLKCRRGDGRGRTRWQALRIPSLFFLGVIYYEELFLKLFCFRALSPAGAVFTLLFTVPPALLLGLLCGGVEPRRGRLLLVAATALLSLWMGAQAVYYHLFKTFLTIFSITKMAMVAGAFGDMAAGEILLNWFPVLMMALPVAAAVLFRNRIVSPQHQLLGKRRRWLLLALAVQLAAMGLVMCCGWGVLSLRYIYTQAAVPELEVQNFGMITQTQLEIRRVIFGIRPDENTAQQSRKKKSGASGIPGWREVLENQKPNRQARHVMDIDFDALMERDRDEPELLQMHQYFSTVEPTPENQWTGYLEGKNLIWIVAEGFCTQAMDPQRTPMLWRLSHEGFVFDHFYTPLWGVSTSDGEYVTTTGLIPKSGVWSYSQSAQNFMPFGFGWQFQKQGYRTLAYHDYLYTYYDRNLSHPNMGYEYRALGHGLELEQVWPPSDVEMMEKIVPEFVGEDHFMVYCLTVSGHLNYTYEDNAMSRRHWDVVEDMEYSEPVKAYLACQMELELALQSLVRQLEEAGKLENTVIVLSGDHYPYGLTDEEYSELLGHPVDPVFEIYENTLILWTAQLEEPVHVGKYCSSLDIMPTLANLFGLEYDSRLMAGRDILSREPGLVIFSNYSFITPQGMYNSITDLFETWDGSEPDLSYVAQMVVEVQNKVAYSASILDQDYYRAVLNGPPRSEK